jgi:hypothetical protein
MPPTEPVLPPTGLDSWFVLEVAVIALVGGGALRLVSRRRRRSLSGGTSCRPVRACHRATTERRPPTCGDRQETP